MDGICIRNDESIDEERDGRKRKGFYGHNPCVMMIPAGCLVFVAVGICQSCLLTDAPMFVVYWRLICATLFSAFSSLFAFFALYHCLMVLVYKYPRVYPIEVEYFGRSIDGLVRC